MAPPPSTVVVEKAKTKLLSSLQDMQPWFPLKGDRKFPLCLPTPTVLQNSTSSGRQPELVAPPAGVKKKGLEVDTGKQFLIVATAIVTSAT